MKSLIVILAMTLSCGAAYAADEFNGETQVRSLEVGQGSFVIFKNVAGETERTYVSCSSDEVAAKNTLSDPRIGGIMLLPGSSIVFKNDLSSHFMDGSNLKGKYIQFVCAARNT